MKEIEKKILGDPKTLLETLTRKLPNSIWIVPADLQDNVAWVSSAVAMQRGFSPEEVLDQTLDEILTEDSLAHMFGAIQEEFANEEDPNVDKDRMRILELEMKCKNGTTIWTENQITFIHDENGELIAFLGATKDVNERKIAQARNELALKIMEVLNEGGDVKSTVERIVLLIRENLGISSISFRILDENGDFPHYVSNGFSSNYLMFTNSVLSQPDNSTEGCRADCLCGSVVKSELDDRFSNKTKHGSFWTGDLPELKAELGPKGYDMRPDCVEAGFNSLALIPIKTKGKVLGLMQLAALRKDIFDREMIQFFERIVTSIGVAIEREKTEKELSKKDEQLRHSQRLDSIGRLAGGIAHDFNNLLTAMIGYVGFLLDSPNIPTEEKEDIMEIQKAGKRAAELTKQLLAFSRKQVLVKETIDVNDMFIDFQKLLLRVLEENIDLNYWPSKEELLTEADKSQLEQIIMNLVVNARDALPNGGLITVHTQKKVLDKDILVNNESVKAGNYVSIQVSDNGVGIEEEDINKVFEPFFTTKSVHQGSGLGLSVVYGIVRQHDGHIIVKSKVGEGTTVEVLLPMSDKEKSKNNKESEEKKEKILKGRKVFVIEDDIGIQKIVLRVLKNAGAQVAIALNVREAYDIYKEKNGEFDIIVSDVVLPDGKGPEVIMKLREDGFQGALLLTSGYPFDSDIYDMTKGKSIPFIQKPFSPRAFVDRISALIKEFK